MIDSTSSKSHSGPSKYHRLAVRLKQVSDLTRLRVVMLLSGNERSVGALCGQIACSHSVLSRHLALMRLAGLVVPRRAGQQNYYSLTDSGRDMGRIIAAIVG
jgi:DNA-binding transcriptional ArsR family regulator